MSYRSEGKRTWIPATSATSPFLGPHVAIGCVGASCFLTAVATGRAQTSSALPRDDISVQFLFVFLINEAEYLFV